MSALRCFVPLACLAGLLLAPTAAHAAPEPRSPRIVIDCDQPKLPTQREVGELLDQHNAGQVYASRSALMAEARRTCLDPAQVRRVAFEPASARTPQPRRIADRPGL